MKLKEQIANFFTLMNLACGTIAVILIIDQNLFVASLFVFTGALFDFADGFIARALGISSELGKQLDSLSDVVTFGVVPGLIAHELLTSAFGGREPYFDCQFSHFHSPLLSMIAILIPLLSAFRLAKFNIDTRQSKNFIGLPTPANGILWASFGIVKEKWSDISLFENSFNTIHTFIKGLLNESTFLIPAIIVMSLLLVTPLNLMGMKFDKLTWQGNEMKFSLILVSIFLLAVLGFSAIPIILLLYILFSIIHFYILKTP